MTLNAASTSPLRRALPRVSIGMPVYNAQRFVAQAVESLLSQTFDDFELIISDNASTDETETICRNFARRDERIRYLRNDDNIGAAANFNRVFHLSRAPYFKWAAADDMHAPTYVQRCVEVLDSDASACLCHSLTLVIDEAGTPLERGHDASGNGHDANIAQHNNGRGPRPVYDPPRRLDSLYPHERFRDILIQTRWCFEIFGLMRRRCVAETALHESYYGSDKVLLSAMSLMGRFVEVPEPLFLRRYHGGSSTSMRSAREREIWMNPTAARKATAFGIAPVLPRVRCLQGYCKSIAEAGRLNIVEQARCFAAVGSYLTQADRWMELMREQG